MARYTATLSADTDATYICDIVKPRTLLQFFATLSAYGGGGNNFGGGTLSWLWSPDGGTTKIALFDMAGNALSQTGDLAFNMPFGNGDKLTDAPKLYVSLTGSTDPTINVVVFDNR